MKFNTAIAKVRGHGSSKEGVRHWWHQRLSAILLVPLSIWFLCVLKATTGLALVEIKTLLANPLNTIFLVLFIMSLFYHAQLGLQVIIEDYIKTKWLELSLHILVKLLSIFLVITGIVATLKIFIGN